MKKKIRSLLESSKTIAKKGVVASYIPELGHVDPTLFGLSMISQSGEETHIGDTEHEFTVQSISKIILLISAFLDHPFSIISEKVSFEPTSEGFNSIVSLETKNFNRPLNPMINSGAIVCTSLIKGNKEEKMNKILSMTRKLCSNESITVNEYVYESEKSTGFRNYSLAYFLKSTGMITDPVEDVLDVYFRACSMTVTTKDLANLALTLAKDGVTKSGDTLFSKEMARIVRSTIALCGLYDESGDFALKVGLPSKSGVSGAIMSVVPKEMGICVFSPPLNEKGNSVGGIDLLQKISELYNLYIY